MKATMKVLLATLVLATGAVSPLLRAQDEPAKKEQKEYGRRGGDPIALWREQLALTDAQVAKIKPILEDQNKAMQALAPEERRTKGMEIRKAHLAQVRAVLTPEQQVKFDAMPQRGPGMGKKKDAP